MPLFCLLLERVFFFPFEDENLSGYLDVERVAVTVSIKEKEEDFTRTVVLSSAITPEKTRKSLEALTQPFRVTDTTSVRCPTKGTKSILGYRHLGETTATKEGTIAPTSSRRQKIPRILHQQGSSRCVSSVLYDRNEAWEKQLSTDKDDGDEWSIYFHTEDAMTRLFRAIIAVKGEDDRSKHSISSKVGKEFPQLGQVLRNCVDDGSFSKHIIWRFLCLYVYGGMYVDLKHALPPAYHGDAKKNLRDRYDSVLLWSLNEDTLQEWDQPKNNNSRAEVRINPNIIAVSPGHPLMYYAVQHVLFQVTTDGFSWEDSNELKVVSDLLERALADFLDEYNIDSELINKGKSSHSSSNESDKNKTFPGTGNTTVTILHTSFTSEAKRTAWEAEFSEGTKLIKGKQSSLSGRNVFDGKRERDFDKSQGKSSCLRKMLTDVLSTV